jgi:hypothetical protein
LATGKAQAASKYYSLARDWDALQFRSDRLINQVIREVASFDKSAGVTLLDVEKIFSETDDTEQGIPVKSLFMRGFGNQFDHTVQAPLAMSAKLVGNSILISWPDNGVNYTLQMTSSLLPPTTTAPVTPVKANGQVIATVTRQFNRLSQ